MNITQTGITTILSQTHQRVIDIPWNQVRQVSLSLHTNYTFFPFFPRAEIVVVTHDREIATEKLRVPFFMRARFIQRIGHDIVNRTEGRIPVAVRVGASGGMLTYAKERVQERTDHLS